MSENSKPDRYVQHWETTAVTALPPGWFNVYDCEGEDEYEACPAVLVQELRRTDACWDVPRGDGTYRLASRTRDHEAPYETRVVFASHEMGYLDAAQDVGNYTRTVGPSREEDKR